MRWYPWLCLLRRPVVVRGALVLHVSKLLCWHLLKMVDSVLLNAVHLLHRRREVEGRARIRYHGVGPKDWRGRTLMVHAERTALGGNIVVVHYTVYSRPKSAGGARVRPLHSADTRPNIHTYHPY